MPVLISNDMPLIFITMQKLVSIDLKADFGFFRKPDTNAGINLSYNMLHKPALLGILGAIIGLEGYKEYGKLPEYYNKLKNIKIGIEPLEEYHEKGNLTKTVIRYSNTVGYANKGTNYLTEEATLIKPAYRCYILLDIGNEDLQKLYEYLKEGKAEYLPYFGKNEFSAWWERESFEEYPIREFSYGHNFTIASLIHLEDNQETSIHSAIAKATVNSRSRLQPTQSTPFLFFERLPSKLEASEPESEKGKKAKYNYDSEKKFIFSNAVFEKENKFGLQLYQISENKTIHLF
jgi:CRISPR-associated protein Cas5h